MKNKIQELTQAPIMCDYEENGKVVRVLVTEELYIKRTVAVEEIKEDNKTKKICEDLGISWL